MDPQSLLVFILLPLVVLTTAITLLLIQRARRKQDKGNSVGRPASDPGGA